MSFFWGFLVGLGVAHFIYGIVEYARLLDDWMQSSHD